MTTYKQIPTTLSNLKLDGRNTNNKSETLNIITTTQRDAIPIANLADGMQIFNSTLSLFQGRVGGAWTTFMTGGLGAFTAPSLATAPVTVVAGMIYEDTVTNQLTAYNGTAWGALYRTTNLTGILGATQYANTGALPATPASGTLVAQTDIDVIKHYNGTAWSILFQSTSAATGVGLTNLANGDTPFTKPTGTSAAVEVAGNQVNGFGYYNSTATNLRSYSNAAWCTLFTTTNTATGVGLTAGNTPFVLPSGVNATVEAAGNQVNGFMYYGTTSNTVRLRVNGAWVTMTTA